MMMVGASEMIVRAFAGLFLSFALAAALGPWLIKYLREHGAQTFHWLKQDVDNRLFYELHQKKIGTPAMGGLLMLVSTTLVVALLYPRSPAWVYLAGFVVFSAFGFLDDISKALVKAGLRKDDFAAMPKFIAQWAMAFLTGWLLYSVLGMRSLALPFVGSIDLGFAYVLLAALTLTTTANAANITDGLDGLAGGLAVIALTALLAIGLLRGNGLAVGLAAIMIGATLGFLAYNIHPARVFMGDVGSMGLGAGMATIALLLNALIPFVVIAGVFAVELLSSLIQTIALRRGRKVFKIAPLHHHFEALGWPETRITQTFWLVGTLLAFAGVLVSQA